MKDSKLCFIDVETTGLDPIKNDIIVLSCIIEINGLIRQRKTFHCSPFDFTSIDPGALMVNGITTEEFETFPDPYLTYAKFVDLLNEYVDKYNPQDKFYFVAYRADFDYSFVKNFFIKCDDRYFNSYFNTKILDPLPILRFLDYLGIIDLPDYKLLTVAANLGIPLKAHDASQDVSALQQIFRRITGIFNKEYFLLVNQEEAEHILTPFESETLDRLSSELNKEKPND
jgi:DNA polymerase III epsilon subunit-like protein